ncbi:helix-turn-helix domain-containing protein [Chryseobacterium sp. A321]
MLRAERLKSNLTLEDLAIMTTATINTIHSIEKGDTTNIDYYVEYAKAVGYDFGNFKEFDIELVPKVRLPKENSRRIHLTGKIRTLIIQGGFLKAGKTVSEIKAELVRMKQINSSEVTSADIAGVMRNLLKDNIVQIHHKDGRKNIYITGSK